MKKLNLTFILTVLALAISPLLLLAQASNPSPAVPIDGGASILAAAGLAYGAKKYRDYKKKAE